MSGAIIVVITIWGVIIAWQLGKLNENLEKLIKKQKEGVER